jgi:crossover junction endodeoxyribonuclease RusA
VIIIEVRGLPAAQGSKRHVGRGIMVESSKAVAPWREAVRAETQRVMTVSRPSGPLEGAMAVSVTFTLPRPKSHYGTGRNAGHLKNSAPLLPHVQPDLDKLLRAILDGLTAGGAWLDDSQVVRIGAEKIYGTPGARILINHWPLEAGQ